MLKRCYSEKYHKTKPSYKDCYVCDDWLRLSNFRAWMESQDWVGKQLDKDILVKGVMWRSDKGKYVAQVGRKKGNSGYIGLFETEQEAHDAYMREKRKIANALAVKQTDPRVYKLLMEI